MRIIGVDPGSRRLGYGVVDRDARGRLLPIAYDTICVAATDPLPMRLQKIYAALSDILREFQPEVMAVEEVFFARDAKSALSLGQARGVVLLAGATFGLSVVPYAATFVKKAVSGYGAADKEQVQTMVTRLLALRKAPIADAADALAIAICHAHSHRLGAL